MHQSDKTKVTCEGPAEGNNEEKVSSIEAHSNNALGKILLMLSNARAVQVIQSFIVAFQKALGILYDFTARAQSAKHYLSRFKRRSNVFYPNALCECRKNTCTEAYQ